MASPTFCAFSCACFSINQIKQLNLVALNYINFRKLQKNDERYARYRNQHISFNELITAQTNFKSIKEINISSYTLTLVTDMLEKYQDRLNINKIELVKFNESYYKLTSPIQIKEKNFTPSLEICTTGLFKYLYILLFPIITST